MKAVPAPANVDCVASAPARHLCPFKDEVDVGTLVFRWNTGSGLTIELHSLAAWVAVWNDHVISHEDLVNGAYDALRHAGVRPLAVTWNGQTAGMDVAVTREAQSSSPTSPIRRLRSFVTR